MTVRLDPAQARERFAAARVARLATADADGRPHIVPVVFALEGDVFYTAIDWKPKKTTALRRLHNIAANPAVSVLVDHYDDDWTQLWWARADGIARVTDSSAPALASLAGKYPQYRDQPPIGPFIAIDVAGWSGWAAVPTY